MSSIKSESLGVIKAPQVFQYTALCIGLMHDLSKLGFNNESVKDTYLSVFLWPSVDLLSMRLIQL